MSKDSGADRCPRCGSTDPDVIGVECSVPEEVSDRHIPADELAHEWHFQDDEGGSA